MRTTSRENQPTFFDGSRYPSNSQLRRLFNSSLDIICSIDFSGRFVHMSEACQHTLGYTPDEMIGQCVTNYLHEEDIERTVTIGNDIVRGKDKQNFENRYRRKDGSFITLSWSCHWDARETLMFCIGRDVTERKEKERLQAAFEQKIKENNRHMNEMLDRITDAFFAVDQEWRIVYANAQCEQVLGLRKEDYLTLDLWESFPELNESIVGEQYRRAVHSNLTVHFRGYMDTFKKWFEISAYPSLSGLSVFFRDITGQVQAEEERRRAQEELQRLSLIARNTADAVSIVETDGRISWVNEAYTKLFGYTFEEAVGNKNSELLRGPASDLKAEGKMKRCFAEGRAFSGEILAYAKDGDLRWLYAAGQPLVDSKGRVERFFIIQTDITQRKQKEEQIRKLSTYIQESKDLVVVVGSDCRITWVNKSFEKTTGYSFDEVAGRRCNELLQGPMTDRQTANYMKEKMAKGEPFQAEILNYPKRGEPYWLEIYGQPFFDGNGNVSEYFTIQRNITERKILQQELAQEVNRRQREVAHAVIATQERERAEIGRELHDNVNQILTTVKLYQDLVLSGIDNEGELVKKSIELLLKAINENRSLSKRLSAPTLGKASLAETVKELVDTVAAAQKFELTHQTATMEDVDTSEEINLAVYRILQEHLTNVSKYAAATVVHVCLAKCGDGLVLEVTDDGRGFDPAQKRSGIGITNMQMRAESLNGTLTLDTAPGKGCRLLATFPLLR